MWENNVKAEFEELDSKAVDWIKLVCNRTQSYGHCNGPSNSIRDEEFLE
jgi:hypothetical protein